MLVLRTENYSINNSNHRNLLGFIDSTKVKDVDNIYYYIDDDDDFGCASEKMKDLKEI